MTQASAEKQYIGREGLAPGRLEFSGWRPYLNSRNPVLDVHTIQIGGRSFDVLFSYTAERQPFVEGVIPEEEKILRHGFYLEGPIPHALRPLVRSRLESGGYQGQSDYPDDSEFKRQQ